MAGKGSKIRKGANHSLYWENFPFPERLTVTQWIMKHQDQKYEHLFTDCPAGKKITEEDYLKLKETKQQLDVSELTEEDIEKLQEDMNSISFSEFNKILNRKH